MNQEEISHLLARDKKLSKVIKAIGLGHMDR